MSQSQMKFRNMLPERDSLIRSWITFSVIGIILFRLTLIVDLPIADQTEARYAEIARIMEDTGNWIVPHVDYDMPFWAKPPLSTWLSAASFKLFGVSEWTARFPTFLLNIVLIFILAQLVKPGGTPFYLIAFILLTTPQFLIHTGAVSTDTVLGFCVAMVMLSFWQVASLRRTGIWGYGFFLFLGLGLLAKGPLIFILTIPPIILWLIVNRIYWRQIVGLFPWLGGIAILLAVAVPWYYLAEVNSPGFLQYFLVGEHFKRFLVPGWQGDLYGVAKTQPKGMIWIFLFLLAFPWFQIVLIQLWKIKKRIFSDPWITYLVFWMFWTPFFFTFSSHIVHTYIVPVLVPIALLAVHFWAETKYKLGMVIIGSIFYLVAILAYFTLYIPGKINDQISTDKYLIEYTKTTAYPIYYWREKTYSGQFYSMGKASVISDTTLLCTQLDKNLSFYLIVKNDYLSSIPGKYLNKLKRIDGNTDKVLLLHLREPG